MDEDCKMEVDGDTQSRKKLEWRGEQRQTVNSKRKRRRDVSNGRRGTLASISKKRKKSSQGKDPSTFESLHEGHLVRHISSSVAPSIPLEPATLTHMHNNGPIFSTHRTGQDHKTERHRQAQRSGKLMFTAQTRLVLC